MKRKSSVLKDSENQVEDVAARLSKPLDPKVDDEATPPVSKVTKVGSTDLYKPPTNEELHQLKETENLYHSTLFRMQITELLSEVRIGERQRLRVLNAFETIKKIITSIPEGKKFDLTDQAWLKKAGVHMPMVQKPVSVKGTFQYLPPVSVEVTGSFYSNTEVKGHSHPDVVLVMPKESFDPKDFLNQRYVRKRALYLSKIAIALQKNKEVDSCSFTYHHGNHLKPKLTVIVIVSGKKVSLNLYAVAQEGSFKLNRFHVTKNNIRQSWFREEDGLSTEVEGPATPFYNCSILEDLVYQAHVKTMSHISGDHPSLQEGIILLKVWLRQRQLDQGAGGFSGHIMTMFVLYLLAQKKLNPFMSSYQIFKNTILKLSQSDWTTNGVSMCRDTSDPMIPSLSEFHEHADVVFVDPTGYLNLCYNMNKSVFERVLYEARLAIQMLEDKSSDSFQKLFMQQLPFNLVFDHFFHLEPVSCLESCITKCCLGDHHLDTGGATLPTCIPTLLDILRQALGPRVTLIQMRMEPSPQWSVTCEPPGLDSSSRLTVGLILDPQHASSVLDRGPPADAPEAADFREFWGSKSELRRFQDGGICEAVLWLEHSTWDQRQLVCEQVVRYVLHRHADVSDSSITYIGGQLDPLLRLPITQELGTEPYGTGEEVNQSVLGVYERLCKVLRNLKDLPLTINTIQGAAPCFRDSEVFPPLPCTFRHKESRVTIETVKCYQPSEELPTPPFTPSLKVICLLEGSGKWPEDISALRRLKAAFFIQMCRILQTEHNLPVRLTSTHLDVLMENFVFRVQLASLQEITLLRTLKTPEGLLQKRDTDESLALEKEIIALPKITSTLHGLKQLYAAYGPTVRLAKRWLCSHLLGDHIEPLAIELVVAFLFISPAPFSVPSTSLVGFQRFLNLLKMFDWQMSPLMVNLNNEFTDADYAEISGKFSKERSTLPLMFISTPQDKFSNHWTRHKPSAPILNRLVLLANKSASVLTQHLQGQLDQWDIKQIFRPALDAFDALIHLEKKKLPRRFEAVDITTDTFVPKYGKSVDATRFPVTDFDPVQFYLDELRATFGDLCLFFHDTHGGDVIGVVWRPTVLQQKDFKVSHIVCSKPVTEGNSADAGLIKNVDAILEDFAILGKGLVVSVEARTTKQ